MIEIRILSNLHKLEKNFFSVILYIVGNIMGNNAVLILGNR